MRKFLLTSAVALPFTVAAAFAQDAVPTEDPALQPGVAEPMATDPATADPMATDPMATEPVADDVIAEETDAEAMAAQAAAAEKVAVQQAANELRIDWITGTTVEAPDGTNIGSISDLIVDGDTGELKAAVIGVGGFLGIGQKNIALPWEDLSINYDAREITSDLTRDEADAAPEYVFRERTDAPAADGMATDPAMAPAADPMADPAADPMADPAADPMADPAADPMADPAADPMADPAADPAAAPASN
ncbi:MAG: PRC-barrel domain-containing protein [Paracoccus sp. (in: a-proteobacteria)]